MSLLSEVDTKEIIPEEKSQNRDFLPRLISLVQQNRILYEKSNKYYYNRHKKEKVWRDIGAQTNKTATECKAKWTALREKFIRELKKKQIVSCTGAAPEHQWDLFSKMLFLKDVASPRKRKQSMKVVETQANKYPPSSPVDEQPFPIIEEYPTLPPLRKRSFDGLCDQFSNIISKLEERLDAEDHRHKNSDADELFMRTILAMIEDFPASVKDEVKADIFNKIIDTRKRLRGNA